jgi:hypothetical protein
VQPEEIFRVWAPAGVLWSDWVAPALFVQLDCSGEPAPAVPETTPPSFPASLPERAAIVLDLPGAQAVRIAMELAALHGYRPVPIVNASPGPASLPQTVQVLSLSEAERRSQSQFPIWVVDMRELVRTVCAATPALRELPLPPDAPPVFILDDVRAQSRRPAAHGTFDNRWIVFPQDFPSARFLLAHGIETVLLLQSGGGQPREDLAHVLRRWQEAGLSILRQDGTELRVDRPSRYRAIWYRALAIAGLRRNAAGGFGDFPEPRSG